MLPSAHDRATEWATAALVMAYINEVSLQAEIEEELWISMAQKPGLFFKGITSLTEKTHMYTFKYLCIQTIDKKD